MPIRSSALSAAVSLLTLSLPFAGCPPDRGQGLIAAARNGRAYVVREFLSAGANLDSQDAHGRTALEIATASEHCGVVELLRRTTSR